MVDVMQDQVKQAKDEAKEAREYNRNGSDPITTTAAAAAIGMVQEASRELMKNSNAPNPVELVRTIVELMPKPAPPPDNAPMFQTMLAMQQESSKTMLTMVLGQNDELKREIMSVRNASLVPVDPMAKLKEIKDYAELMGFSRNTSVVHEPAAPAKSSFEEWGPIVNMALGIFGPVLAALAQKLTGPPTPPPAQPDYSQPPPAVAQQPAPPPPMDPNSPQARQMGLLNMIQKAFLTHLFDTNCDGFTFAQWMISGGTGAGESIEGRALYRDIKANMGILPDKSCGLDKVIQQYPEIIWNTVKSDKPSYYKFLTEFFNYDEQMAGEPTHAKAS
jgi:hypothetical protein